MGASFVDADGSDVGEYIGMGFVWIDPKAADDRFERPTLPREGMLIPSAITTPFWPEALDREELFLGGDLFKIDFGVEMYDVDSDVVPFGGG